MKWLKCGIYDIFNRLEQPMRTGQKFSFFWTGEFSTRLANHPIIGVPNYRILRIEDIYISDLSCSRVLASSFQFPLLLMFFKLVHQALNNLGFLLGIVPLALTALKDRS